MSKKNTLLYLDEQLVERAKKSDINLSKITESAIKSELFPELSEGDKIMFDIEEHLENLREQNRCFSIPFQIEEVIVENLGPIENFEGMFENLNIIAGQNESGKTTLIRSIAYACGKNAFEVEKILRREEKKGKITVKTTPREKMSVELRRKKDGIEKEEGAKCLLLDAPADRLDKNNFVEFLKRLSDLDSQVILTTARPLDDIEEDFINKIHLSK